MNNSDIRRLISRLVKTQKKYSNSKPIPIQAFRILFSDWGENNTLCIGQLRLKAKVLLACMTRPSDYAPKGKIFYKDNFTFEDIVFSVKNLHIMKDLHITNDLHITKGLKLFDFGIKNDSTKSGF